MRTANRKYVGLLLASVAGAVVLSVLPSARAESVAAAAAAASATTVAVAASPTPPPVPNGAAALGSAALLANPPAGPGVGQPAMATPVNVASATPPAAPTADSDDSDADSGRKIPPQVKAVVKKLQDAKVDLSIEDMNEARAALARLDLLLELEKKLGDLDKARSKHASADMADEVSSLLPRGVAHMPTRGMNSNDQGVVTPVVIRTPASAFSVVRINGIDGVYSALLLGPGDDKITVRVGDKLPDGTAVTAITTNNVSLRSPNETTDHMLHVNNASPMSNGRRAP